MTIPIDLTPTPTNPIVAINSPMIANTPLPMASGVLGIGKTCVLMSPIPDQLSSIVVDMDMSLVTDYIHLQVDWSGDGGLTWKMMLRNEGANPAINPTTGLPVSSTKLFGNWSKPWIATVKGQAMVRVMIESPSGFACTGGTVKAA